MSKYKVSFICPSINPDKWTSIYESMSLGCKNNNFEFIFVGPQFNTNIYSIPNAKYIMDFGSPSRCFQIGSLLVEGEFLAWCSDDYIVEENAVDETFEYIKDLDIKDDGINLLYSEGLNFTGDQHLDKMYWWAHTHPDLRHPGVSTDWWWHGAFMYRVETWYKFGGLDCAFEHVNMNTHDLGFAVQANGGRIINSPRRVFKADCQPRPITTPVLQAFYQNDRPRFAYLYSDKDYAYKRKVDINNWKNAPSKWSRRFG